MIAFWGSLLFMVAMLDRATRIGRIDLLILRARRELYSLRNQLRWEGINSQVNMNSWVFDYLDTSLTRTAHSLPAFTVYAHLGNMIASRSEKTDRQQSYALLRKELARPENKRYRHLQEDYEYCLEHFLSERHKFAVPLLRRVGLFNDGPGQGIISQQTLPVNPNVSTLAEYCHR